MTATAQPPQPLIADEAPDAQRNGATCGPDTLLHVLYVEDNRINAMLFEEALRPYPQIMLDLAEDGCSALQMVASSVPDVLVLDAHLPDMNGFDILAEMRHMPALQETPAYMCSADAQPEDLAKASSAGFAGYWTKPIDVSEVTMTLLELAQAKHNAKP